MQHKSSSWMHRLTTICTFSTKYLESQDKKSTFAAETIKNKVMALAIKAIPTLYGNEARRFREMADETERRYDIRLKRDLKADPRYQAMRTILKRSNINF